MTMHIFFNNLLDRISGGPRRRMEARLEELERVQSRLNAQVRWQQDEIARLNDLVSVFDLSVDADTHSPSWAVLSVQGVKHDYVKFFDLGVADAKEIERFIGRYERNCRHIKADVPYAFGPIKYRK